MLLIKIIGGNMLGKFLCYIGKHKWFLHAFTVNYDKVVRCSRCDKFGFTDYIESDPVKIIGERQAKELARHKGF